MPKTLTAIIQEINRKALTEKVSEDPQARDQMILTALNKIADNQEITNILLKEVASKEFPVIEFPEVQKIEQVNPIKEVSIRKPAWWKLPTFDTAEILDGQQRISSFLKTLLERKPEIVVVGGEPPKPMPPRTLFKRLRHRGKAVATTADNSLRGDIDSSNKDFTLPIIPMRDSEEVYVNGQYQTKANNDYSIAGAIVTLETAPPTNSIVTILYDK